jgi:hypothetical protein
LITGSFDNFKFHVLGMDYTYFVENRIPQDLYHKTSVPPALPCNDMSRVELSIPIQIMEVVLERAVMTSMANIQWIESDHWRRMS